MEEKELPKNRFGLIGRNISYSFSRSYFSSKFKDLGLESYSYENFDLADIGEFPELLLNNQNLNGLNVTIPYKQEILPYLNKIEENAAEIGAVNTIQFTEAGLIGHNTDAHGFRESLLSLLKESDKYALILGTGGASKAVAFVLGKLGISFKYVSRRPASGQWTYGELNQEIMHQNTLIINTTPLGTHPNIDEKPEIPYEYITDGHFLFDLVYNPAESAFLKAGASKGARVMNGQRMLELQAEKAWEIWNS